MWKRCGELPYGVSSAQAVVVDGKVYIGGRYSDTDEGKYTILMYDPKTQECTQLPKYPAKYFAMASVNNQLTLAGGRESSSRNSNEIGIWDSPSQQWLHPYPPMPTARFKASAIGFREFLIVAGGRSYSSPFDIVEILDTFNLNWYHAQTLPTHCHEIGFSQIGDELYALGGGAAMQVFRASLPKLVSTSISPSTPVEVWEKLPDAPLLESACVSLNKLLLAFGGQDGKTRSSLIHQYNPETNEWTKVGILPISRSSCACVMLDSKQVLVFGGEDEGQKRSNQVYIATIGQ